MALDARTKNARIVQGCHAGQIFPFSAENERRGQLPWRIETLR